MRSIEAGLPAVRALTKCSRLSSYIVCVLAVAGCAGNDASRPGSGDEPRTEFVQRIDLDGVPTDTVVMAWSTTKASDPATTSLGAPGGFVIVDDSLYIADTKRNAILVAGADLQIRRHFGAQGEGPGEFIDLFDLASIGDSILVAYDRHRVQLIDILGNSITILPGHRSIRFGFNDANASWILASSGGADSSFVKAYSSSSPSDSPVPFLSIPETQMYHPAAYRVAVTADNSSVFAVLNTVPAVEIFDGGLNHVRSINLEGRLVEEYLQDPSGGREMPGRGRGTFFQAFFQFLFAECDDLLLVGRANTAWFIRRVDDSFELVGKVVFVAEDEDGVMPIGEIRIAANRAYVSSYGWGAIYSGDLPPRLSCMGSS